MQKTRYAAIALGLTLIGCSAPQPTLAPEPKTSPSANAASNALPPDPSCPDDGPRLPISGICQGRGVNHLDFAEGPRPKAPDGCFWVLNETQMPGNELLLYMALKCKGVTTTLEFAGGAKSADLSYSVSALAGEAAVGQKLVTIIGAEDPNPQANLQAFARETVEDEVQRAQCSARAAGREDWPADAVSVDAPQSNAPVKALCGPYGNSPSNASFWRIFNGFAWHFDLGKSTWEVDPGSFTVIPMPNRSAAAGADGK